MRAIKAGMAAFALLCGMATSAQETRVGEEGFESPSATLEEMSWLVGQWTGQGIGGSPAMESWLAPTGGTMVGTFVQTTKAEDGSEVIMFTEHLYMMEEQGSLVLRLKHFNADLTGWEEKDGMLTFRLVAIEPCAAYFNALTLRCDGDNGLLAAVRMKSDKPEPQELIFRFTRTGAKAEPNRCPEAVTTLEINECLGELAEEAENRRVIYRQAAIEKSGARQELIDAIMKSEEAFSAYRERECEAVYEDWKEGSIRYTMALTCQIDLSDQRTHTIWETWLTYPDSTPPILPEPGPTN